MRLPHILILVALLLCGYQTKAETDKDNCYLFVYFTGNAQPQEAIHYAVADSTLHFTALNNGNPILDSRKISISGGVRDPYIMRCNDGTGFYMVATDMVCSNGWDSNRGIVLMYSPDLLNWRATQLHFPSLYKGQENLKRVWAPEVIYDHKVGKYMVYYSLQYEDGPDVIYYSYANKEFTRLEGRPKPLFIPSNKKSCIDGDIVLDSNGIYHLFYKTEGNGNGIKEATTKKLTSGKWIEQEDYKQQTTDAVEGAGVFKVGSGKYILMYDVYSNGRYEFCESNDLYTFKKLGSESIGMNFHPRHGCVMQISAKELERLKRAYPSIKDSNNPILPEFHADPEILYSNKTNKYYIYSTTDGYLGWGGTRIGVYSSTDLINFRDEGVALDLKYGDVRWADGNAWAPAAIEVKQADGSYKYYLYFSGNDKNTNTKKIGVAVSNDPCGPFIAMDKPLVADSPTGNGQQIDVDVFQDPISKKYYLYWGNGYMAGAELNLDLTSIKKETITILTPEGGTLADYAYREAPYVFWRNGKYYFMWSVDDTGSANYHIAYGTSNTPLGKIKVATDPIILEQEPTQGIYGTGHNAVIKLENSDKWYIVYHRINKNYLERDPGIHRQVCIDAFEFLPNGDIKKIIAK